MGFNAAYIGLDVALNGNILTSKPSLSEGSSGPVCFYLVRCISDERITHKYNY
ncbi:Uncharacterised protein [Yersinia frederiksenii]|nr:Uncharacterised protein [Yersinia frederiksenii]CNC78399.1 Uncharacterised protein [Yersinia frederiksenii]CNH30595.1 Uncharacterised protein [Yersinia frederiksenii]CNH69046.1 Uncharacterised protein [Yersinia frederiksenii]CNI38321.1 Uncharacterised protein [Yersinia frederiksenii]